MDEAIEAVAQAFVALERGQAEAFPVSIGRGTDAGTAFSMKGGRLGRSAVGLKVGSYWPANRERGLPNHGSFVMLLDPDSGFARALVSTSYLNGLRTAAADGIAVRHLARPDARVLALVGAGHQAWFEYLAVRAVRPIEHVLVASRNTDRAEAFATRITTETGVRASARSVEAAVRPADIVVTATAARNALVKAEWVRPGTHISAMGADARGKQELDPALVGACALFADVVAQSLAIGELQTAAALGLVDAGRVTPIGAVIAGRAAGRTSDEQTTLFDSSGVAVQDLAVASLVLERASERSDVPSLPFMGDGWQSIAPMGARHSEKE
jgi:ornithine cyclodeaminase